MSGYVDLSDDDPMPGYDAYDLWVAQRDDTDHYISRLIDQADIDRKGEV